MSTNIDEGSLENVLTFEAPVNKYLMIVGYHLNRYYKNLLLNNPKILRINTNKGMVDNSS